MMKLSLTIAGMIAIATAMFAPSVTARAQGAGRFEYLRLAPYATRVEILGHVEFHSGYRACVAATPDWTCREFAPTESTDAALRTALATLGNERWELVSVLTEDPERTYPKGLMYLFKRPAS
jgi:hypothetical protein